MITATLLQDLRYAVRALVKRPIVTVVAIGSLALGIGITTAIFSVFERMLLQRLPVPAPEEIVLVTSPGPRPGSNSNDNSGGPAHTFSYPLFRDLERLQGTGLSALAAHRGFAANLAHGGLTERTAGLLVSGHYFPALRLVAASGRLLTPDDDRGSGSRPVVVLAYRYWSTRFAADADVLNTILIVNGEPMTIVGVAPAGFDSTTAINAPDLFVPLAMAERVRAGSERRDDHWLYAFGRLQPGITREQAQVAMTVPFSTLIRDVEFPLHSSALSGTAREQFLARRIVLEDGQRPRNADRADVGTVVGLMLAITGLVLLIACTNLANLMLARAAERSTEIAVRLSIGASRGRLLRLFMTEAVLLGVLGALGALIVAPAAIGVLLSNMPVEDRAFLGFGLNGPVLAFAMALGFGTAFVFGLLPAVQAIRRAIAGGIQIQTGRASDTRATTRFRSALATAQIALAIILLIQAGLFLSSFTNVSSIDLGIQPEGLITFRVSPLLNGYSPDRALDFAERLEDSLRGLPGVSYATASSIPLLANNRSTREVTVEGFEAAEDFDTRVMFAATGADYVRTVGMTVLAGRDFTRSESGQAAKVAIVNEAFARKFNLGSRVVGRRLAIGEGNRTLDVEIVGLVRDSKYSAVIDPAPPQLFVPLRQERFGSLTFYVRSSDAGLFAAITAAVRRLDQNLPVERLSTMDAQIWNNVTRERVLATLSSWFAALAMLLAGIGLYAILAYAVGQRSREIGIRVAFGANPGDVCGLVLRHVGRLSAIGGTIGLAAALGLGRLSQNLMFGVEGSDPSVIGAAVVGVALVTIAATALPLRRAARIDPVVALRSE